MSGGLGLGSGAGVGAGGSGGPGGLVVSGGGEARLLKTMLTKNTPVCALRYTPRNLLLAAGVFAAT